MVNKVIVPILYLSVDILICHPFLNGTLPLLTSQASQAMFHGCVFEADLVGMEHALRFEDVAVRHVLQGTGERRHVAGTSERSGLG